MANTPLLLRSTTAGNKPSSLASGQIAINEADGRLFYRASGGTVTPLPSVVSYATTASFPATGLAGLLYLSSDTSKLYRWESTIYVEVASVATSVSAADLTSGTLPDARLSSAIATYAGMTANANQPSSVVDAFFRGEAGINTLAMTTGTIKVTFFTPLVTTSITQITFVSGNTAASGLTLGRFGLYTWDETTATLVARTASDTTLFAAINTAYSRSLDSTGGYPTSYTLTAGVRYGIAMLVVGTTMPTIVGRQIGTGAASLTPRMSGDSSSRTDLPTSTTLTAAVGQVFARLS